MRMLIATIFVAVTLVAQCHGAATTVWVKSYTDAACKGSVAMQLPFYQAGVCFNPNATGLVGELVQCPTDVFKGSCATIKSFAGNNCSASTPSTTTTLPCGVCTALSDFGIVKLTCSGGAATINYKCDTTCGKCNSSLKLSSTSACYNSAVSMRRTSLVQLESTCTKKFISMSMYFKLNQRATGTTCTADNVNVGGPMTSYFVDNGCVPSSNGGSGVAFTCTPPGQAAGSALYVSSFASSNCAGKATGLQAQIPTKTCSSQKTRSGKFVNTMYTCPTQVYNGTCVYASQWLNSSKCTGTASNNVSAVCGTCMGSPDDGFQIFVCDTAKQTVTRKDKCNEQCTKCNRTTTFSKSTCTKDPSDNTTIKGILVGKCTTKYIQMDTYPVLVNGTTPTCKSDGKKIGAKQTMLMEDGTCSKGMRVSCTAPQL